MSSFRQSPAPSFNRFVLPSHSYEFGERIKRTSSLLQSIRLILKNTRHFNCIVHSAWLFPDQNAVHFSRLYNETPLNCRTWFRACSMCGIFTLRARRYSVRRLLSIFVHSSAKNMDKTTEDKHLQRQHWITRKTVNPRALKLQQTTQHPRKMGLNLLNLTINNTRTYLCQTLQQGEPFLVCDWLWFVSVHVQLLSCPP